IFILSTFFVLFSFVANVYAQEKSCVLDQWLKKTPNNYQELTEIAGAYISIPTSSLSLPPLKEAFWPLNYNKQQAFAFDLVVSKNTGNAVHQTFSQFSIDR